MNGTINGLGDGLGDGLGELENQLRDRLHGHSRLAPDRDGWEGILDRIEQRGRAHHRRRAAAAGLAVVGVIGTLVVLTGGDATRVSTTPAPPAGPAEPVSARDATGTAGTAGTAAAGGLPRLVLDVPGFRLGRADSAEAVGPPPDLGPLLVYAVPGDGLLGPGPVLFARLVPAGVAYGIGDGPEVKPVDVAGRPGRYLAYGAAQSLGWPREDGSIVHLTANAMPEYEVLAAGQAIEAALALGQDPPATLAGGLDLRRSTTFGGEPSGGGEAEVSYQSGDRHAGLWLVTGGTYRLDNIVLDRLASSAGWRPATVSGRSAVLSTYVGDGGTGQPARTLLWAPADGVVAELRAQGLSESEMEAAAGSIHEVDDAQWNDLLARSKALEAAADPGRTELDALHGELTTELCQLRNTWMGARATGDAGAEAAAVADLEALVGKGRASGLGDTGDILVVAQRLLDGMAAGDVAAVSSISEGGPCS